MLVQNALLHVGTRMCTPTMPSTTSCVRTSPARMPTAPAGLLATAASVLTTTAASDHHNFVIGNKRQN